MASGGASAKPQRSSVEYDRPTVEETVSVLRTVTDWYTVGVKLGLPTEELDNIRCSGGSAPEQKRKLARLWLEEEEEEEERQWESPSWDKLRIVLNQQKMIRAVSSIDKLRSEREGAGVSSGKKPERRLLKLDSRPKMANLQKIVGTNGQSYNIIQECAAQWKELADFLLGDLSLSVTREIERDPRLPTLPEKCRAVFEKWLDGGVRVRQPVTWNELLTVLGDLEKGVLVSDLKKYTLQHE